ncbi:hypothetical protein [Methylobacterium sp. Leaf85]|uniref:hypothetical protein n=1 Tax=Methylobacterium sp. Leaf85 TaxID=1736241 RepID=UPI000A5D3283|nr:hypothetical protein [Methylobacterium sp. Leaf85]
MWTIFKAIDRWRVWDNLLDYPVYLPPFRSSKIFISRKQADANYKYFESVKAARVDLLIRYLSNRSVHLRLKQSELTQLDRWVHRYGGHLLPDGGDVIYALSEYEPVWKAEYHGLNIIHDVAILVGDYIVSNNPDASWGLWYGDGDCQAEEMPGFYQPCIFGLTNYGYNRPLPILYIVYEHFESGRLRLKHGVTLPRTYDAVGNFAREIGVLATKDLHGSDFINQ